MILISSKLAIPTEKAVIRKNFVCYAYNLFVYVLTAYRLVKQENYRIKQETHRHIFTVIYRFHKINSSRHNNILAFEIRYYNDSS